MYLIHIPAERAGVAHWLYFDHDPRPRGCVHNVYEGVEFKDLDPKYMQRKGGDSARFPVLARSEQPPHRYQVFPSWLNIPDNYERLDGFAFYFPTWEAFLETPVAKDEEWRPII